MAPLFLLSLHRPLLPLTSTQNLNRNPKKKKKRETKKKPPFSFSFSFSLSFNSNFQTDINFPDVSAQQFRSRSELGFRMAEEFDSCSSSSEFKESSTQLSAVAEAFEELARIIKDNEQDLPLSTFCDACALVSVLFGCLGIAFKFAEYEYVSKVNDLLEASKTYDTLGSILDHNVQDDSVKKPGSLSRHLRRVRQGLDLIRALFENFLSSSDCSLRDAASTAYAQVCAPYHTWAIRKAVSAGMYALPTREQLILRLNETDESVGKEMKRYIVASSPVIDYIDNLYLSRDIGLDW